jgi:hypothetical protein
MGVVLDTVGRDAWQRASERAVPCALGCDARRARGTRGSVPPSPESRLERHPGDELKRAWRRHAVDRAKPVRTDERAAGVVRQVGDRPIMFNALNHAQFTGVNSTVNFTKSAACAVEQSVDLELQ